MYSEGFKVIIDEERKEARLELVSVKGRILERPIICTRLSFLPTTTTIEIEEQVKETFSRCISCKDGTIDSIIDEKILSKFCLCDVSEYAIIKNGYESKYVNTIYKFIVCQWANVKKIVLIGCLSCNSDQISMQILKFKDDTNKEEN